MLRCRVCQAKWRLPSTSVPRCRAFFDGHCALGNNCQLLHVHKKKQGVQERVERFGNLVVDGQGGTNDTRSSNGSSPTTTIHGVSATSPGSVRYSQTTSTGHSPGISPRPKPAPVCVPINPYLVCQSLQGVSGVSPHRQMNLSTPTIEGLPAALPFRPIPSGLNASGVWSMPGGYTHPSSVSRRPSDSSTTVTEYDSASNGMALVRLVM